MTSKKLFIDFGCSKGKFKKPRINKHIKLPWTEKYRPNKLNNIVSQKNIINCLKKIIENQSLPHLLFYGSSGTGKTSTILAISKLLYGPNKNLMVLELNASDDRGINLVREEIKEFAESISIFSKSITGLVAVFCE